MTEQQTAADTSAEDAALLQQIREMKAGKRQLKFALAPEEPPADERSVTSKFLGSALASAGQSIAGIPQSIADALQYAGSGDMGAKGAILARAYDGARGMIDTGKAALGGDPEAAGSIAGQLALAALTKRFAPVAMRGAQRVAGGPLNRMMPPQASAAVTGEWLPAVSSPVEIAAKLAADDAIRQPAMRQLQAGRASPRLLGPAQSIQLPESSLTALGRQHGTPRFAPEPVPTGGPRLASMLDELPAGTRMPDAGLDQISGYGLGRYADDFNPEADFYNPSPALSIQPSALEQAVMGSSAIKPRSTRRGRK